MILDTLNQHMEINLILEHILVIDDMVNFWETPINRIPEDAINDVNIDFKY